MERHWQRDHGIHYSRFGHKQRRKRCLTLHLLAIIVVHHRHHHALPPPTSPLASHTHLCILHRHTLSRLIPPVNARLSRCHPVLMAAHLSSLISRPPRLFSRHRLLVLFPSPSRSLSLYDTFCTFNVLFSISFTSLVRGSQLIAVCIDSKKKKPHLTPPRSLHQALSVIHATACPFNLSHHPFRPTIIQTTIWRRMECFTTRTTMLLWHDDSSRSSNVALCTALCFKRCFFFVLL